MNTPHLTSTEIIVAVTCLISFVLMQNSTAKSKWLFHPFSIHRHNQWYRFISSGFIHADMLHLLINMFVLWSFGSAIEKHFYPAFLGSNSLWFYFGLYFGGIVVAAVPSYFRHRNNPNYAALGASGGVSAVVFAIILFAPWQNLYLWGVLPLPQILAGAAYLYYSWYKDKHAIDNIGHMAHFSGALWGFVYTCLLNPALFGRFLELSLQGPSWL